MAKSPLNLVPQAARRAAPAFRLPDGRTADVDPARFRPLNPPGERRGSFGPKFGLRMAVRAEVAKPGSAFLYFYLGPDVMETLGVTRRARGLVTLVDIIDAAPLIWMRLPAPGDCFVHLVHIAKGARSGVLRLIAPLSLPATPATPQPLRPGPGGEGLLIATAGPIAEAVRAIAALRAA